MGCRICTKDNLQDPIEIQSNVFENFFETTTAKEEGKNLESVDSSKMVKFKAIKHKSAEESIDNHVKSFKKSSDHKYSCESKDDELIHSKEVEDQNSVDKKKKRSECNLVFTCSKSRTTKQTVLKPEDFYDKELKEYAKRFFIGGPNSVLPNDLDLDDESINPKHLSIKYIPDEDSFVLSERKQSTGLFLKLKKRLIVDKNTIICFRNYHILISRENDDESNLASEDTKHQHFVKLKIRFLTGDKKEDQVFSNRTKCIVKIGRSKQCQIVLKDEHVSRVHCRYELVNIYKASSLKKGIGF